MAKDKIRSFIAIDLPEEFKILLNPVLEELKRIAPKIKWIKTSGIHITLKFLGDISPKQREKIESLLESSTKSCKSFELSVNVYGAFPNTHKPRVIWLGFQAVPEDALNLLHKNIEENLESLGFDRERRKFSPHVTIGRLRFPIPTDDIWAYLDSNPFPDYRYNVDQIVFYRSILKPSGAEYSALGKYSLQTL
jgi:2'-5' RNA ligase